jgi:transcriptional regulator with XRE-family HTH domain
VTQETLGQRIRQLRQERRLSLAKVAGSDFSRAFLNQIELGKSRPSMRVLRVIATRLGAPIEYLLEGETPTLDRQIALERARIDVARGRFEEALAAVEPALHSIEWPLGADAGLCAASAFLALGRRAEADWCLSEVEVAIKSRGDTLRQRRLRALRSHRWPPDRSAKDPRAEGEAHLKLAERALRAGDHLGALERYREARVLLEATAGSPKSM